MLAPRLLASLGAQRQRYGSAADLQCYTGVAPVTKQSGGKCHVHRRYRCPKFHRQSFHEYAQESLLWCRWAAAAYLAQRTRGKSHHTAVRALAFKWQRIIFRCWQDRQPYNDQRYETVLGENHNPLVALWDQIELGKSPCKTRGEKLKKPLTDYLRGELSDSRPAVITPATLDNQSASPKPATLELQSGAAVRLHRIVCA